MLNLLSGMHKHENMTIIMISHYMDEIAQVCTKVLVMENGSPIMYDDPREVFKQSELLNDMGLDVPVAKKLAAALKSRGIEVPENIFTLDEMQEYIAQKFGGGRIA
jgi:energy-coupling factor transport system ATP-binding protein